MFRELGIPRSFLIYILCLPLAVVLGYLLATPLAPTSYMLIGLALGVLALPALIRWHHLFLIACWNAAIIVFFLPGQPTLGMTLAAVSLGMAVLARTLRKENRSLAQASVTRPLLFLMVIVVATAEITGGFGGRVFGGETWGAKRYLGLFGATVGYFALVSRAIPPNRRQLYASLFFLSGTTSIMSDLAYMAGPSFYFLFALFPSDLAVLQSMTVDYLFRLSGLAFGAMAAFMYLLMRYGIRGILDVSRPWRLAASAVLVSISLLGGYRSLVILMALVFLMQFWYEGLMRTKLLPALLLAMTLGLVVLVVFIERMPLSVQRTFSFLPLDIDPSARLDAMSTLDWRISMWKVVLPEVPKYLLVGKGYGYSGTDYFLTQQAIQRGLYAAYEDTLISGNYHNGLLTILIPFGILGFLGFFWFCRAAYRVLRANYLYGLPELRNINTFLLSYFMARLLFYLVFYGQFDLDLYHFTGLVGLSLALNGGVHRPETQGQDLVPEAAPSS